MSRNPSVFLHFRDVEVDETIRESIHRRCDHLADEFHEVSRFDLTISENGVGYSVHGHATGKNTDIATHADAELARLASDQVLDKIERQLRRVHDKRIFSRRREAQRDPPKRRETH
jgi:ribosomal subunit interface protein